MSEEEVLPQQQREEPDDKLKEQCLGLLDRDEPSDSSGQKVVAPKYPFGTRVSMEVDDDNEGMSPEQVTYLVHHGEHPDKYRPGDVLDDLLPAYLMDQFERICKEMFKLWEQQIQLTKGIAFHRHMADMIIGAAKEKYPEPAVFADDFLLWHTVGGWILAETLEMQVQQAEAEYIARKLLTMQSIFVGNAQFWFGCGLPMVISKSAPDQDGVVKVNLKVAPMILTQDQQEWRKDVLNPGLRDQNLAIWLALNPEDRVPSFIQQHQRRMHGPSASSLVQPGMQRGPSPQAPQAPGEGGIVLP